MGKKKATVQDPVLQKMIDEFRSMFEKARDNAYPTINIANEFGLGHQEIKHSAFLTHLFDPNRKAYCLRPENGSKAYFLRYFFGALEKYVLNGRGKQRANSDILSGRKGTGQAVTAADIGALGRAEDLTVKPEPVFEGGERKRIDILLYSEREKTALIIENKVFSTAHDDQLREYEKFRRDSGWKRVFVYLTPEGSLPQHKDGSEAENWCAFDYSALRDVVELFKNAVEPADGSITALKGDLKKRLIFALEDYMENIMTEVLKKAGGEMNGVYAELLDQYPDLAAGFYRYCDSARPLAVANYCKGQLGAHSVNSSRFLFYTDEMKNFFARHNEDISNKCYIVCQGANGNKNAKSMELRLELCIPAAGPTPAQALLMADPQIKKLRAASSPAAQYYRIIPSQPFLRQEEMTAPDGTYLPLKDVLPAIDGYLQAFKAKLALLESVLKTL